MYQTGSMSIRASVPMMCAVLGPAAWDADSDVDSAPLACVKIVATSSSTPVAPIVAVAVTVLGAPEDVPGERDRVDAEVEQGAAAEIEVVEAVGGIGRDLLRVVGEHRADVAERTRGDELADADHVRQVAGPHRLHREQTRSGGDVAHGGGLGAGEREGLLDEHVLAVLEREDRVLGVHRMRRRRRRRCRRRGRTTRASYDPCTRGMPNSAANRAPDSAEREPTAVEIESGGPQVAGESVGDSARGKDSPAQSSHPSSVSIPSAVG